MSEAELFVRGILIGLEVSIFIGLIILTFIRVSEEKSSKSVKKSMFSLIGDILRVEEGNIKAMQALDSRISDLETAWYGETEEEKEEAEENE